MELKGVDEFTANMEIITYAAMAFGLLWSVAFVVIGGMLLAGSGTNAQKRNLGLSAIFMACLGVYIIYKAYTIAGWTVSI